MVKMKENLFVKFLKENFNAIKVSILNSENVYEQKIEDEDLNKALKDIEKMEVRFEKNTKLGIKTTKTGGTARKQVIPKVKVEKFQTTSKDKKKKIEKDFER